MPMLARTLLLSLLLATPALAENHEVVMLNTGSGEGGHPNVFEPALIRAEPGDTVTFRATDAGHNSASKRGMIPEGAEPWNGGIDEEITVTLPVEGVYGYICVPHYEMGMVGLIVVGDPPPEAIRKARKVRHPGDARKAFRALFRQLEETSD